MLIMRYYLPLVPAETGLRPITSSHVQFWIWPAQFVRALVLAAALFPLRAALIRMGWRGGLAVAGLMVGIGCLGGFNGLIEDLIFYRNVSLYLYYIHIRRLRHRRSASDTCSCSSRGGRTIGVPNRSHSPSFPPHR
jgi:hypothetical protein